MKALLGVLVAVVSLLLVQAVPAQAQAGGKEFQTYTGCLSAANGLLLLKQAGGHAYALHGDTETMNKYLDHTVEVQGTAEKPKDKTKIGAALKVRSWKVTGECSEDLLSLSRSSPAWKKSGEPAVPIAGKAGPDSTAAPVTSNRSVGETTPPSDVNRSRVPSPQPQPGQPPIPEDTGQTPAAANRMAVAAQRAEIGTHNGTIGAAGQPGTGTLASLGTTTRPAAIVQLQSDEFQPEKVTISTGQTVAWKNTSGDPHTVTVVPDKALVSADVELPKGAQPFDSGTISPGMSFVHTFTVPGTYRYYCTLHESNGMVGEVIVK